MSSLEDTLKDAEITEEVAEEFETIASQYITAVIDNIRGRFPQAHTLTFIGYLDPWNVSKATPPTMNGLGDLMVGGRWKKAVAGVLSYRFFLTIYQS